MQISPEQKAILGKEILETREALNLTQSEFSLKLGISVRTLNRYESGETVPDILTYRKFLELSRSVYCDRLLFVKASTVKEVAQIANERSRNLSIVKTFIFDAVIRGKKTFVFPGRLDEQEIYILREFGYRVEKSNDTFVIGDL